MFHMVERGSHCVLGSYPAAWVIRKFKPVLEGDDDRVALAALNNPRNYKSLEFPGIVWNCSFGGASALDWALDETGGMLSERANLFTLISHFPIV